MIKTKKGKLSINGRTIEIMEDLAIIILGVKDAFTKSGIPEDRANKFIEAAIKKGMNFDSISGITIAAEDIIKDKKGDSVGEN